MGVSSYYMMALIITLGFLFFQMIYFWPQLNAVQIDVYVRSKASFGNSNQTIGVEFEFSGRKYKLFDVEASHSDVVSGELTKVWFTPKRLKLCSAKKLSLGAVIKRSLSRTFYFYGFLMIPVVFGLVE